MEENVYDRHDCPLVRISLFGTFRVWYRLSPTSGWKEFNLTSPPKSLEKRGIVLAVTLLKILSCQPDRHATRDFLLETLWPDKTSKVADSRLDDTLSTLRSFFRSVGLHNTIVHTRKGRDGNSYSLEVHPIIWIDIDAFYYYIQQAVRAQRLGDNSLDYWEKAHDLAKGGVFLADALYSPWSEQYRQTIEGTYRQCIIALGSLSKHPQEQLLLYRKYIDDHPTDEDILRRFLELLGDQECFQEASQYYSRATRLLEHDHLPLDPRTKEIFDNVQGKQLIRQNKKNISNVGNNLLQSGQETIIFPFYDTIRCRQHTSYIHGTNMREPSWFSLKNDIIHVLTKQCEGRALYCNELQSIVSQELGMAEYIQSISSSEDFPLSRRSLLQNLAITLISTQAITHLQDNLKLTFIEEFLPGCAATIVVCQQLLRLNGLDIVTKIVPTFLPTLEKIAQESSKYNQVASSLTAQSYMLSALIALHQHRISACDIYYQKAVKYSQYAQIPNLHVGVLKQTATRLLEDHKPTLALQFYEQALPLMDTPSLRVGPHLKGLIYIGMAAAYAQKKEKQNADLFAAKAQTHFFDQIQEEKLPYVDTSIYHYHLLKVLIYTEFGENKAAENTFAHIDSLDIPIAERIRLEILNHRARTAVLDNDKERARRYLIDGAVGAKNLQSEKRFQEVVTIVHEAQARWPHEHDISELSGLLV